MRSQKTLAEHEQVYHTCDSSNLMGKLASFHHYTKGLTVNVHEPYILPLIVLWYLKIRRDLNGARYSTTIINRQNECEFFAALRNKKPNCPRFTCFAG